MIAEWLYDITCFLGGCLNNSLGFERSPHNDASSGTLFLWFMLVCMVLILICIVILYACEIKSENKRLESLKKFAEWLKQNKEEDE